MGLFEMFMSEKKTDNRSSPKNETYNFSNNQNTDSTASNAIKVFYPKSFEDVSEIINMLSLGKPAIVNIKEIKDSTSQRVLDLLSGAIYALHGGLYEVDKGIFVFTPDGVSVK